MAHNAVLHRVDASEISEETPLLGDERGADHETTTRNQSTPTPDRHSAFSPASSSSSSSSSSSPTSPTSESRPPSQHSKSYTSEDDASTHSAPSWRTLPHKPQLLTLLLASLSSPLAQYSQTPYLFHQVRWFDPSLPSSDIALRAAYLTAAFAAAQCATALLWGYLADSEKIGRKAVLVAGLVGSALAAIGIGFVRTFEAAMAWRVLAGVMTGNGGVARVVVAEVVSGGSGGGDVGVDGTGTREYQARAFLLLPMCYNVGVIVGPLVGGLLADPGNVLPGVVGKVSEDVREKGSGWLRMFPFALPNLVFAGVFGIIAMIVVMGLDETHLRLRGKRDRGRELGRWIMGRLGSSAKKQEVDIEHSEDQDFSSTATTDVETSPLFPVADTQTTEAGESTGNAPSCTSPFRTILTTPNILLTMFLRFLQSLHISAFYAIYTVLLPTPRDDPSTFHPPLFFSGGLGLSPQKMGLANTIIGMIGLPLQILIYPYLVTKIGVRRSYAIFLPLSVLAYVLLPFLILLPEGQVGWLWICLCGILSLQVLSRTFINPAGIMLVNDCAPRGDMLGSVHGLGVTVSSAAKIVGPLAGGAMLGWGLANGCVVAPLWTLGGVAGVNLVVLRWVGTVRE